MLASRLVDVVESAYSLDGDEGAWLAQLARAASPALNRGLGIITYTVESALQRLQTYAVHEIDAKIEGFLRGVIDGAPSTVHSEVVAHAFRFFSMSETFFRDPALKAHWDVAAGGLGFFDVVGFFVHGKNARSVHVFAPSPRTETPNPRERRAWERVAVHIRAAHSVRNTLQGTALDDVAEAVLGADGYVHHARGQATARGARDALRNAVRAMEQARGPMRTEDGERALALWQGLVGGRWSLVERWDTDRKRFIVAVENQPDNLDPRALRPREGAAARLATGGAAAKDIAYALGISPSNARALLASALQKLGLRSRRELLRWNPKRAEVHVIAEQPNLRVLAIPEQRPGPAFNSLTEAERIVAALAADGKSNTEIARARGTSVRTVANQMAAILRKLGVGSRADICALAS
jgi:DNA-binding CsgD family transcriptional regulator